MPRHTEMELLFHMYILIETKTQQHSPQARTMSMSERNYARLIKKKRFHWYIVFNIFIDISMECVSLGDRSQTADNDTESMQGHSFISSSQVATMGDHFVSISVPD